MEAPVRHVLALLFEGLWLGSIAACLGTSEVKLLKTA